MIFLPAAIFLLLGLVGYAYYLHTLQRPVAAIGLIVCGQVKSVTIVMNDGTMKRFDGPDKDAAAMIEKITKTNFSSYGVNTAECSAPRTY